MTQTQSGDEQQQHQPDRRLPRPPPRRPTATWRARAARSICERCFNGDVEQANEADTSAEAENGNETEQGNDQDQSAGGGGTEGAGAGDNVTQTQSGTNSNSTARAPASRQPRRRATATCRRRDDHLQPMLQRRRVAEQHGSTRGEVEATRTRPSSRNDQDQSSTARPRRRPATTVVLTALRGDDDRGDPLRDHAGRTRKSSAAPRRPRMQVRQEVQEEQEGQEAVQADQGAGQVRAEDLLGATDDQLDGRKPQGSDVYRLRDENRAA